MYANVKFLCACDCNYLFKFSKNLLKFTLPESQSILDEKRERQSMQ